MRVEVEAAPTSPGSIPPALHYLCPWKPQTPSRPCPWQPVTTAEAPRPASTNSGPALNNTSPPYPRQLYRQRRAMSHELHFRHQWVSNSDALWLNRVSQTRWDCCFFYGKYTVTKFNVSQLRLNHNVLKR